MFILLQEHTPRILGVIIKKLIHLKNLDQNIFPGHPQDQPIPQHKKEQPQFLQKFKDFKPQDLLQTLKKIQENNQKNEN